MKGKTIFRFISLCLLMLAVSSLWIAACASGGGSSRERKLAEEKADIEVFVQIGHTNGIESASFSPDGKWVLSGSSDNTIKLWEVATGREIRTFRGHTDSITSIAFSPDGRQVLSGSRDKTVKLWDATTGREIRTFAGHKDFVNSVAFSPDSRQVLSSSVDSSGSQRFNGSQRLSGSGDVTIKLWNITNGQEIRTFSWFVGSSVIFNPDGTLALSCHSNGTIKLWDIETGREIRTFSGHAGQVKSGAFSPDGTQVLSGADYPDNTIKLWDIETGREISTFRGHRYQVTSVAFSPDGRQVLSGSIDRTIKLWDIETGREISTFLGHTGYITSVSFNPDGRLALSCSSDSDEATIRLWDIATVQEIRTILSPTGYIYSISFNPNGKQIISGYDKTIRLWDIETGQETRTFSGHTDDVNSVAYSPDGKQVLSGSSDRSIKLWDTTTGEEIRTFTGHTESVDSVAFSPDGRQVLSGGDNTVKLWDAATGREIRTFQHGNYVYSVAFSPDGRQVLSGSFDGTIKLWDAATGREIRTLRGHTGWVDSVAFSPDGKQVLSESYRTIKLWDATTGREIRNLEHTSSVNSIMFSPDGGQVLSSYQDGTIKLWDAASGVEIKTFEHTNSVGSITFSPDGRHISGSSKGTVLLWDVATSKELAQFISFSGNDTQLAAASRGLTVETQTAAASNEGEWLSITPDGYYNASPRGDRYLNVRVNNTVSGIDAYRSIFYNPDVVQARLQGRPDPKSKANVTIQQAASFTPPEVAIQSPANFTTTNTATTNLSVAITSQSQPVKNIKILVNGRLIGKDELASVKGNSLQAERASLTVTGNQKTVNFTLPLELEPGNNRIEVVAFNGYSENRRYVDVTRNAPAGERPALPNLWVVAVGVNSYDNAGPRLGGMTSLNFAVADAKGLVQSLKAQEGKRYAKVNTMLIADGEQLAPTAENIKQGFKFLEGADPRRDVVVLFLAGHGISAQESKFFFLPKDAAMNGKNVDATRAISGDEIMTVLDAPGNRLVFIDACQSGGVDNDRMVRSLMDTNAFVFAASRGNELSYESRELGHGFFTHSIMSALGGAPAALSEGRNVSVLSMSGFVKDDVPKKTGGRQNPSAYSLGFYDFPMAVIRQ